MSIQEIMRSILIAVCCLVVSFAAGCQGKTADSGTTPEKPKEEEVSFPPNDGPPPKAIIPVKMFEFGKMVEGETKEHTFTIRNEGEGDLIIKNGGSTCKCTLSDVKDTILKKGETKKVTLTWTPKAPQKEFIQTATVLSNDPQYPKINLRVRGSVSAVIVFDPPLVWTLDLKAGKPAEFSGKVYSPQKEDLAVKELKSQSDVLDVKTVPMTKEELKELDAKSGFWIKGTVNSDKVVGNYSGVADLKLNLSTKSDYVIKVRGHITGPFKILGRRWEKARSIWSLGEFPAEKGQTAHLTLYIDKDGEKSLEVKNPEKGKPAIETKPNYIQFQVEKDPKYNVKGKEKFSLTVTIPPNIAPTARDSGDPGVIIFHTTHKSLPKMKIHLHYQAY